ncbi:MAG: GNAT family N-acetyltransferase [Melioribacteraceae bacterium]|nr:GNAT family N-acetyltransferase [Melioribacteraceae bacterium]
MKTKSNRKKYLISADKRKLKVLSIHKFLTNSYWAKGIPIKAVKKQIKNSFCFGVYNDKKQIGYARIITDYVGFAYLCDVYIEEDFRGKGLSKWLMEEVINHPKLKNIKTWMLSTNDAHGLYAQYGFKPLDEPQKQMRRVKFKNWADK